MMIKQELEQIFKKVEDVIKECIKKGLSTEMILIEGLPKLKATYGLNEEYYKKKLDIELDKVRNDGKRKK